MKKRKRVKQIVKRKRERKKTPKKISRLQASAGEREDLLPPMPEWPRYFKAIKKPVYAASGCRCSSLVPQAGPRLPDKD